MYFPAAPRLPPGLPAGAGSAADLAPGVPDV